MTRSGSWLAIAVACLAGCARPCWRLDEIQVQRVESAGDRIELGFTYAATPFYACPGVDVEAIPGGVAVRFAKDAYPFGDRPVVPIDHVERAKPGDRPRLVEVVFVPLKPGDGVCLTDGTTSTAIVESGKILWKR